MSARVRVLATRSHFQFIVCLVAFLSLAIPFAWPSPSDRVAALPTTGPNVPVATGPTYVDGSALAVDATGILHIVWKENATSYWGAFYSRSTDGGLTWRTPVEADPPYSGTVLAQSIAVEREAVPSQGHLYVVYAQKNPFGNETHVWFTSSTDGIAWSAPVRVDTAATIARATDPSVAASNGRVWVAWTDWRLPGEPHTYLRRTNDEGVTWGPETDLSDVKADPADDLTVGLYPRVEAKGDTVAVVWSLPSPPAIASARTDDAGATWRKSLAARGDKSYESLNGPDLFLDDLLVEHLVYAHAGYTRAGPNYIRWTKVSYAWSADGLRWSAPVRVDDGTNGDTWVSSPTIAGLGGTLWAAWGDNRTGVFHVYASWSTDGARWGDGAQNGNDLRVDDTGVTGAGQWFAFLRTGAYGVYVSWQDYRADTAGDIYFSPLQTSPLVITEIQDEPAAFARVEVFNTARTAYGLAGALLHAGATTVALDPLGSVPAHGHVVIGASADADLQTPLAMGTEGALVWIGRGTDVLASAGSGSYGIAPDPLPGESTARFGGTLDYVGPWTRSATPSFHARNAVPPPNLAPDLVLNEVFWNAFAPADRFAEVYYRGGGTLSLAGYHVVGDTLWTLTGGSASNASRHSVVSAIVAGTLFDSMALAADDVYLYDPAWRLLDMVGWTSGHTQGRSVARVGEGLGGNTAYDDASAVANGWAFDQFVQPAFLELGPPAEVFGDRGSTVEFPVRATSHAYAPDYVNLLPPSAPPPWSVSLLHTDRTPITDSPGDADALPDLGLVGTDASASFLVDVRINAGGPEDGGTVTLTAAFANFVWTARLDLRVSLYPYVTVTRGVAPSTVYVSGSGPPYNEIATVTVNAKATGTAVPITAYRDIVFLVDDNTSMNFLDPNNLRTEAVKDYVELMRPQDRAALVGFHGLAWTPNPYRQGLMNGTTGGKGILEEDADSLACSPYCYSPLPPDFFPFRRIDYAIELANRILLQYGDPSHLRMIVAFTAGPCWPACTNITSAVATAARNGIAIYSIGMGLYLDEPMLKNMAGATGGRYYHVIRPQDLSAAYKGLASLRDDTAAGDPDPTDTVPMVEDHLPTYIVPLANSYVDPATGTRRDPDAVVQLADRTLLQWNVPKLAVGATWDVRYNVSSSQTGTLDVALYPDSRLAYADWAGTPVTLPIPPATLTVLPTPTPPYIVSTIPTNGAVNVPLDTYIEATFSEAMDAPTVRWTVAPGISETPWWAAPNMLYLNHTGLRECVTYTVEVTQGLDRQGESLTTGTAANPWSFSTICTRPYVVRTSPAHNDASVALDASIVVTFSERMDPAGTTATIAPNVALAGTWDANGEVLTLTHADPFLECTVYTVTASGTDPFGAPLVGGPVPNPWSFQTVCPPKVRYTITRQPAVGVVLLNGVPWAVPADVLLRPGETLRIEAPAIESQGPSRLAFQEWSDGGARDHGIIAGDTDTTITATYRLQHPASLTLVGLSPAKPATVTFMLDGIPGSVAISSAWSSWVDDGSELAVNETVPGATGERWATRDPWEWIVTAPVDATVRYAHQYAANVTAEGLTVMAVTVDYEAWGVARRGSAAPSWLDWVDAGSAVSVPDTISVGPRERYRTQDPVLWTANAPLAATVRYMHQFEVRVTLDGTNASHTVSARWRLDGILSTAAGLFGAWTGWADAGTTIAFDERTTGDVPLTAIDPTSLLVDRALDTTIRYTASAPPAPPQIEANWKPLVSLVYGLLLIVVGFAASAKEEGRWSRLRLPLVIAAPELAIGLVSYGTGALRIPEGGSWLSLGLWANTAVLAAGLAIVVALRRRRSSPRHRDPITSSPD